VIPEITHQQFLVLYLLLRGEMTGAAIREKLAAEGVIKSGPAFYQFMTRMERAKLTSGRYSVSVQEGQRICERLYAIAPIGRLRCSETLIFYTRRGGG
jgi:DNA-binding PadR family transcriptional regulator